MVHFTPVELLILAIAICSMCTILFHHILYKENIPFSHKLLKQLISIWMGIIVVILNNQHRKSFGSPKLWSASYMDSDGILRNLSDHVSHLSLSKKPTIFITTTDFSVTQIALLIKTGQALFPARDKVVWIVVTLPLQTSKYHDETMNIADSETFGHFVSKHEDIERRHFKSLKMILTRFGINYKLLRSPDQLTSLNIGFGYNWPTTTDRTLQAYQTGLLWVIKNLSYGVIVLGNEKYVYNSALFKELQKTVAVSCWSVGENVEISRPIYIFEKDAKGIDTQKVIGYNNGSILKGLVPLERGNFAVDLNYLRIYLPFDDHWKLSLNGAYTSEDLKIDLKHFLVLGKHSEKIYSWRTKPFLRKRSNVRKVVQNALMPGTNVKMLLETNFGPRFYLMRNLFQKENISTEK